MAQDATTVTPPSPTPPTNMVFRGETPPTPPGVAYFDDGAAGDPLLFAAAVAATHVHEGAGTEVSVVAPGSRVEAPTVAVSDLGAYTTTPNGSHASSLSPAAALAITPPLVPDNQASGAGTLALTVNGTGFTPQSVVYVNGVAQTTVFVSSTQLTVAAAPRRASAGTSPVKVVTAGTVSTAPTNWTFT